MALDDRLTIGSIIFEHVHSTIPPKDKYYIIVGVSDDNIALGTVYINSEINPNIFKKEHVRKLHVKITPEDNPFLKWDSYIDCSAIEERNISDVHNCVTSGGKYGYTAQLPEHILHNVIATLDAAITIAPITKKKYKIRQ